MKKIISFTILFVMIGMLVSCSKGYKDGTYLGEYVDEEGKGKVEVSITLEDNKFMDCTMVSYDEEGNVKGETYGENSGKANYELAQIALQGMKQYPGILLEVQDIDEVDAVSGATISHKQFISAVKDALKKAK